MGVPFYDEVVLRDVCSCRGSKWRWSWSRSVVHCVCLKSARFVLWLLFTQCLKSLPVSFKANRQIQPEKRQRLL